MKTSTTLVIMTITMLLLALPTGVSADYIIVGDVDDDGRITISDVKLALQMATGSIAPDLKSADVNCDGTVDAHDALIILTMAQTSQVSVDAPEIVSSGAFNLTIDIYDVTDLDSGQFELTFDSAVVNVTGVSSGEIGGTTIPVESWYFTKANKVCVLFNLPEVTGVTGDGHLATISFTTTGAPGDASILELSDELLVDVEANKIPALWFGCKVAIGVPVTINALEVVSDAFTATIDIEDVTDMNGGQFDMTFDPAVVNVTNVSSGEINGTAVPIVDWRFMDNDTVKVLFKLSSAGGVSGSGYVATIDFTVTGSQGDSCVLGISDGMLSDTEADKIPVIWINDEVTV